MEQTKDFKPILKPILDQPEKRVIQFSKDSLQTFHLHNQVTNTKNFTKICKDVGKAYPVMSCLSTDSLHLTILFSNSDVHTLETQGFKEIDLLTLKADPADVTNIITTNVDNLKVIITTKVENGKKQNKPFGQVQIHDVAAAADGKLVPISQPITKGFTKIGFNDTLVLGCYNRESDGTLIVLDIEDGKQTLTEDVSSIVKSFSIAYSSEHAAIWLEQGYVAMYNISNGEVVQQLNINNTITSFGVSWMHDLVFIGDNQGQMILYKGQTGKHFGDFKADNNSIVQIAILEDQVVTLSKKNTSRIWELSELLKGEDESSQVQGQVDGSDLLNQKDILGFDTDLSGKMIVTASEDKDLRVWSVEDVKLQKKIHLGIFGHKVRATLSCLCVVLDNINHVMKIVDFKTGTEKYANKNVVDFCISKTNKTIYLVKSSDKKLYVEIMDLTMLKTKNSFLLKQTLLFEKIDLVLNESERYLVLRVKIFQKEVEELQKALKKDSSDFSKQSHWHRFYAVDLTQATGGLMPCNRVLNKVPHLGNVIRPYKGNVMMISTSRWVVFWDIPTGNYKYKYKYNDGHTGGNDLSIGGQKVTNIENTRQDQTAGSAEGTSLVLETSLDGKYIVVGSKDGHLIVWEAKTGLPVGRKEPVKRHHASVVSVAISPDSQWVVSYCINNMLKLWDITTGLESASLKIPSDVKRMSFTADSKHLVINTGEHNTRMLVYRLHTGQENSD